MTLVLTSADPNPDLARKGTYGALAMAGFDISAVRSTLSPMSKTLSPPLELRGS